MDIYFAKASHLNNIYKIADFFSGSSYIQNANKKLSVNVTADDGFSTVVCPSDQLPDETFIRDYTHVMIPSLTKIYEITSFQYVNGSQVRLVMMEDALIGNYQELKDANLLLNRSNDSDHFVGLNDIKDTAIKHSASVTYNDIGDVDSTGYWMLFTFQADAGEIEFEFGDIENYPSVGDFSAILELTSAFPNVLDTTTPFAYDYYLKFATVAGNVYQCVYMNGDMIWTRIYEPGSYDLYGASFIELRDRAVIDASSKIALTGDIDTINVLLPLDATLVQIVPTNNGNYALSMPSFYHYKSNNAPDKLLSVRLIPEKLLGSMTLSDQAPLTRLIRVTSAATGPYYMTGTGTGITYESKIIKFQNTLLNMEVYEYPLPGWSLPIFSAKQFRTEFSFAHPGISAPIHYEPFGRYFLSFYGALVPIPARYASSFNVRLAMTATSILFEVFTDRYNIIGSGDLKWFTRFTVDLLDLYQANNPTYKEQYWTGQVSSAIRSIGGGAVGGFVAGGPAGAAAGLAAGTANAVMSTVTGSMNMHFMEKGLRDNADQIQGINDVALSLVKGFDAYIIKIVPESSALDQMQTALELVGFPCQTITTIDDLTAVANTKTGLGSTKVIQGQIMETVRSSYVTASINNKLREGVIII
jgi:hypothetical protein